MGLALLVRFLTNYKFVAEDTFVCFFTSGVPKDRSRQMGIRQRVFQARAEGAPRRDQAAEDGDAISGNRKIRRREHLSVALRRRRRHGFDVDGVGGGCNDDPVRGFIGRE